MARGPTIKAVNLSEVRREKRTAEQASFDALKDSLDEDVKKKTARAGRWITAIATIMSIYWAGAVGSFIWGLRESGAIEPTAQWWLT